MLKRDAQPTFLIDESLDPNVARALSTVKYSAVSVRDAFPGRSAVKDPEIIDWCTAHEAVWVHADKRARTEHRRQILASGIRTLFVHRPKGIMSGKEQLMILAYVLPDLIERFAADPRRLHYRVSAHGEQLRKRIRLEGVNLGK